MKSYTRLPARWKGKFAVAKIVAKIHSSKKKKEEEEEDEEEEEKNWQDELPTWTKRVINLISNTKYSGSSRKRTPLGRDKGVRNRPFYRYSGHIEFIRFKGYYGMPRGGTRSVFTRAFGAKRELHCIFLGKKTIIITSKHDATIFFSHYNLSLRKLQEKLARKARVNTERVYRIVLMPPGNESRNTPWI